ncbi:hypothetical protein ACFSTC_18505 [Nonomuraea ferruginea]
MKVILLAAALLAVSLTAPAQAGPHHDAVRYASIKGCDRGDDGRAALRPVAAGHAQRRAARPGRRADRRAQGRRQALQVPPRARRGQRRRHEGRVLREELPPPRRPHPRRRRHPAAARLRCPRVPQYEVGLVLSDDGGWLAVTIGTGQVRIFDTSDGARLGTLPRGETLVDFSGDGGEVLTTVDADESVTDVVVRADTGELVSRATPPQLVSANMPLALAADGRTAAAFVASKSQLVLYDVETDQVLGRVPVKLPKGDLNAIDWTGDRQVTLHLTTQAYRMNVVQIDTETGAVRLRDRYTVLKDSLVVAACGG